MISRGKFFWLLVLLAAVGAGCGDASEAELVSVQRIWDQAPHSAFTDLIRFKDVWYCTFREGESHVSAAGSIRVIRSVDGESWESAAHLPPKAGRDLRDPKLVVTPDGRLMLLGFDVERLEGDQRKFVSFVSFSSDGSNWSELQPVADPDFLLWRVAWHKGTAYGVAYTDRRAHSRRPDQEEFARLYRSEDGVQFDTYINYLFERGAPTEASTIFLEDETALCLLRRDRKDDSAQIGISTPPYSLWEWKDLGLYIGGPHLISLPDGRVLASGRLKLPDDQRRTVLWWLDPEAGKVTEILRLPSAGDTSYPGLVLHEGLLWISYYSTHEEKTSIYLAKVRLPSA